MSEDADAYFASMGLEVGDDLKHYGKKGMKWGVRKARPDRLDASDSDTEVTKKAKADYNNLNDSQFMSKYATTKNTYAKRVEKHGDPYAAKNSQKDRDILEARDRQVGREQALQRQAFKTYAADGERAAKMAMNKYDKMELDLLSNPDAATALKMTKGEKIASGVATTLFVGAMAATVASSILGSRRP